MQLPGVYVTHVDLISVVFNNNLTHRYILLMKGYNPENTMQIRSFESLSIARFILNRLAIVHCVRACTIIRNFFL